MESVPTLRLSHLNAAQRRVARNIPQEVKMRLGPVSARAVDNWRAKWGGTHGTKGSGQEGYRHMLNIFDGSAGSERSGPENRHDDMARSLAA
jgi:hypothetical protein